MHKTGNGRLTRRQVLRYGLAGMLGASVGALPVMADDADFIIGRKNVSGSYFKLGDMEFTVKKTMLLLTYSDEKHSESMYDKRGNGLRLYLGVETNGKNVSAYEWEPYIYHNEGIKVEIKDWKELHGIVFEWEIESAQESSF